MGKFFICLVAVHISLNSWAWTEKGNGGNSVICERPERNKFYDAYEAEYRYQLKPIFPIPDQSCTTTFDCLEKSISVARLLLQRIPKEPSELKNYLLERIEHFSSEVNILDDIILMTISDTGYGFIPRGCQLHQTVIQRPPIFPTDKRYIISNDFWKLLPPNQQAVGIIHELLYSYLLTFTANPTSSERIRYLNTLIISGEIERMSQEDYLKTLRLVFSTYDSNLI